MYLEIDGKPVDRCRVICLHQWDPWPGGHAFRLALDGDEMPADWPSAGLEPPRDHSSSNELMLALQSIVEQVDCGDEPVAWVLNRVERIERAEEGVLVVGVASRRIAG
jgi:hypothetical protein